MQILLSSQNVGIIFHSWFYYMTVYKSFHIYCIVYEQYVELNTYLDATDSKVRVKRFDAFCMVKITFQATWIHISIISCKYQQICVRMNCPDPGPWPGLKRISKKVYFWLNELQTINQNLTCSWSTKKTFEGTEKKLYYDTHIMIYARNGASTSPIFCEEFESCKICNIQPL